MADDRMNWKTPVFFVLAVLLVCVVSYFAGRVQGRRIGYEVGWSEGFAAGYAEPHPADTSTTIDTSHYDKPEPVEVHPAKPSGNGREKLLLGTIAQLQARLDSLAAAKPDTTFVEIPVQMEEKVYEDSTYRAQVSGWHPSLDWIEVFARTQTITSTIVKEAPRWSLGVTAGPGLLYDGKMHAGLGIVAGVQYRF